jgi:hypothetical protein
VQRQGKPSISCKPRAPTRRGRFCLPRAGQAVANYLKVSPGEEENTRRDLAEYAGLTGLYLGGGDTPNLIPAPGGKLARTSRMADGRLTAEVIGRFPAPEHFETVAETLDRHFHGEFDKDELAPALVQQWTDFGIHPGEIAANAMRSGDGGSILDRMLNGERAVTTRRPGIKEESFIDSTLYGLLRRKEANNIIIARNAATLQAALDKIVPEKSEQPAFARRANMYKEGELYA